MASLSHLAEDAGDADDPSPALFEHGTDYLLDAEIGGGQIGVEDGVPIGALHAHEQLIAGDASVIDQNVDFAELRHRRFDAGLYLLFVRNVHDEGSSVATGSRDLSYQFVEFLTITRGYSYGCALPRQRSRAGMADALRRSRN